MASLLSLPTRGAFPGSPSPELSPANLEVHSRFVLPLPAGCPSSVGTGLSVVSIPGPTAAATRPRTGGAKTCFGNSLLAPRSSVPLDLANRQPFWSRVLFAGRCWSDPA